jgi:alpha-amylase
MMKTLGLAAGLVAAVNAGMTQDWKKRSIYQVLTDRFSQGGTSGGNCDNLGNYCGGVY